LIVPVDRDLQLGDFTEDGLGFLTTVDDGDDYFLTERVRRNGLSPVVK